MKDFFPIFAHQKSLGRQFIYLDSGATTHKPKSVIDAMTTFYETSYATVHRGFYQLSEQATQQYDHARATVARFINARYPHELIFTKGTTEGINFVAQAWARRHLKAGDEILLSEVEHHANLLPWQYIAQQTGAMLKFIPLNVQTHLLEFSSELVNPKTRLIAVTHSSNVLGEVWGIDKSGVLAQIRDAAECVGAKFLLDAAQSIPHQPVDVQRLGCDFLVFSGHKMYGPTGIGGLFIKAELHDDVDPYQWGGTMVDVATWQTAQLMDSPYKFEAGTPPVAEVIGLGAAIDFLNREVDMHDLIQQEATLCRQLLDRLAFLPGIEVFGNRDAMRAVGHLVALSMDDIHVHDLASFLGDRGIAVRVGNHCAQPLMALLGKKILLRPSLGVYSDEEDIEIFCRELARAIHFFRVL